MLDLSDITGYISILFWLVVFIPQLYENYQRQSGDGLSLTFLIIWLAGDIFNLIGIILEKLMFTMFLLALWYTIADICLIWQVVYYQDNNKEEEKIDEAVVLLSPIVSQQPDDSLTKRDSLLTRVDTNSMEEQVQIKRLKHGSNWINIIIGGLVLILFIGLSFYGYYNANTNEMSIVPQIMGWSSAILYVGSRLPQIIKNWRQKSTDGLSPGMFICAVLGNLFFALSIFLRSTEKTYLLVNLSWIIGSLATVLFDMIIFFQFYAFEYRATKKST